MGVMDSYIHIPPTRISAKTGIKMRTSILDLWLGDVRRFYYSRESLKRAQTTWYGEALNPQQKHDVCCKMRKDYGALFGRVAAGQFDDESWPNDVEGLLSFVILSHPLGRRIHKNKCEAYSLDEQAINRVKRSIDSGIHRQIMVIERKFLYLPLVYSENIGDHTLAKECHIQTVQDAKDRRGYQHIQAKVEADLECLNEHTAVLERFGRYPHRNAVLQRTSTQEEMEFLEDSSTKSYGV
uniref:DUF924 domain-containing protein n=1 Tax=Spongospora subterranea TaxID=70186 RepID=A0A0H5RP38_9EUKA|eukprot:CRZ10489.1 hypothetical protein [Spongospora subterranea]